MLHRVPAVLLSLALLLCLSACGGAGAGDAADQATATGPAMSGRVEAGLRVLTVDPAATTATDFKVYRGDYVRLESTTGGSLTIAIAELKVNKSYPVAEGEKAYFKVPNIGSYAYTIGNISGAIEAIDYVASGYQEVGAAEAAALIKNIEPLVLDVRTPREFADAHIANAKLIPVQVLQNEIGQLAGFEDKPVFIYCRSGNRSTVAAKMLMDKGFNNVINLRRGLNEWQGLKLPMVR